VIQVLRSPSVHLVFEEVTLRVRVVMSYCRSSV